MTKQELEQAIKNEETIYMPFGNRGKIKTLKLGYRFLLNDIGLLVKSCCNEKTYNYKFKNLYKTKEEAEWVANMHTSRVEKFEPPFELPIYTFYKFATSQNDVLIRHNQKGYLVYNKHYTKNGTKIEEQYQFDTYQEAVEYARKLFLGDSYER